MNENQIVLTLLKFYKDEGVDLYAILDDPIFTTLKLDQKVQMIKDHARAIHDGTSTGMTRRDWRGLGRDAILQGIMGGMTGMATSAATAKLFTGGRPSGTAVALATAAGVGSGLGLALVRRAISNSEKSGIRSYLGSVANNPTDEGALRVLAKRNLQNAYRAVDMASYNKFLDRVALNADERAKNVATRQTVLDNNEAGRFIGVKP